MLRPVGEENAPQQRIEDDAVELTIEAISGLSPNSDFELILQEKDTIAAKPLHRRMKVEANSAGMLRINVPAVVHVHKVFSSPFKPWGSKP
jgi:hypothetical protein